MIDEGHARDGMYDESLRKEVVSPTIMMRLDSIDTLLETLHKEIIGFEGQVAPVLKQEPPRDTVREESVLTATDDSAVISQRLGAIQRRINGQIEEVRSLSIRVEV